MIVRAAADQGPQGPQERDLMLRIDKANKALIALEPKTMREFGYWERRDIQEMICRSPGPFCEELGEEIHIIGSEAHPTDFVQDRIDLLAVDPDGGAVIIEIKRDSHKLHLLQALSYAGMVAKWEPKQFIEELCRFNRRAQQTFEQAKDQLEEILEEGDIEAINRNQRIVLLAEAFDYEVLVTAEWLTERYDVDFRCYRVALAKNGDDDFLTCTRAYPPPELTDIAIRRRQKKEIGAEPSTDWDGALKFVENPAVLKFFRQELSAGRPNNVKRRALRFFIGDRRRFIVLAKRKWARIWQSGRFDDDVEFWTSRLGERAKVKPVSDGRALRFYLSDEAALEKFNQAASVELANTEFQHSSDDDEELVDEVDRVDP
jgi:hypothetical protein